MNLGENVLVNFIRFLKVPLLLQISLSVFYLQLGILILIMHKYWPVRVQNHDQVNIAPLAGETINLKILEDAGNILAVS